MYQQALRVALQLMIFRGGPQDMPFSLPLTRAVAVFAVLATVLLLSPVTPLPLAFATGLGGAMGVAFFTRQLLRGRKLDNRLQQAVTAQLLTGGLFALVMWPAFNAMAPAMLEVMTQMRAAMDASSGGADAATLDFGKNLQGRVPGWAALWSDVVFIWSLAVAVRINRLAADLNTPASVLLTLLSLFVLMGFVLLAQLVVGIAFGLTS